MRDRGLDLHAAPEEGAKDQSHAGTGNRLRHKGATVFLQLENTGECHLVEEHWEKQLSFKGDSEAEGLSKRHADPGTRLCEPRRQTGTVRGARFTEAGWMTSVTPCLRVPMETGGTPTHPPARSSRPSHWAAHTHHARTAWETQTGRRAGLAALPATAFRLSALDICGTKATLRLHRHEPQQSRKKKKKQRS